MPRYRNPNSHIVNIMLLDPRIVLPVYPHAWAGRKANPANAVFEVELDERIARQMVTGRMLERCPDRPSAAPVVAATSPAAVAPAPAPVAAPAPAPVPPMEPAAPTPSLPSPAESKDSPKPKKKKYAL